MTLGYNELENISWGDNTVVRPHITRYSEAMESMVRSDSSMEERDDSKNNVNRIILQLLLGLYIQWDDGTKIFFAGFCIH